MNIFRKRDYSTCIDLLHTNEYIGLFDDTVLLYAIGELLDDCNFELKCLVEILVRNKGKKSFCNHLIYFESTNVKQLIYLFKILIKIQSIEQVLQDFFQFEQLPLEFCEYLLANKYITSDIKIRTLAHRYAELSRFCYPKTEHFKLYLKYIPLSKELYEHFLEVREKELTGIFLDNDEIYELIKYYRDLNAQKSLCGYNVKAVLSSFDRSAL